MIGASRVGEQLDKALTRADKSTQKELDGDSEDFEHDLEEAEEELAKQEPHPRSKTASSRHAASAA